MEYYELVRLVETNKIKRGFDVISSLIGYKQSVDRNDLDNILKLYGDMFIDEL